MAKSLNVKSSMTLAEQLATLGLYTDFDLVLHFPLRYEDLSSIYSINSAPYGKAIQVEGIISDITVQYKPRKQLLARLTDSTGEIFLRFINFYPSTITQLHSKHLVKAYGELRHGFFGLEMVHPKLNISIKYTRADCWTPIYSTTANLSQIVLRKRIESALSTAHLNEILPIKWLNHLQLPSLSQALKLLHNPPINQSILAIQDRTHPAWKRIQFEELLAQQLSLKKIHQQKNSVYAPSLTVLDPIDAHNTHSIDWVKQLLQQLPFRLTAAQLRVWHEIMQDLVQNRPMHRLLQGDVGSGKTIIATLACLQANNHQLQAALMAPTEILAEQHYHTLNTWLSPLGLRILWLTGSLSKQSKKIIHTKIANGECDIVIGTHALIETTVQFKCLAIAIVDEQHRFGVDQRLQLRNKGFNGLQPHLLMMSATPIPRTLAMTYLADLKVSIIDELPPNRSPIQTIIMSEHKRPELITRINHWLAQGKQAYWVCPLIEESESLQIQTATDTYHILVNVLPNYHIGLIHGQIKSHEKSTIMNHFIQGIIHLLIATTVIEVGVDVPNASLMVIENAERFGLAQLHQLRGRIGRGKQHSICILLYGEKTSQTGHERLNIIRNSNDGFLIAQKDLEMRGPGEFLGAKQSGLHLLRFSDSKIDMVWINAAQACADDLLQNNPNTVEQILMRWKYFPEYYLTV